MPQGLWRREWHTWLGSCPSGKETDHKPCNWGTVLGERRQISLPCQFDVSKKAESSFEIEVPKELIPKLTIFQKVGLMLCLKVPSTKLHLEMWYQRIVQLRLICMLLFQLSCFFFCDCFTVSLYLLNQFSVSCLFFADWFMCTLSLYLHVKLVFSIMLVFCWLIHCIIVPVQPV